MDGKSVHLFIFSSMHMFCTIGQINDQQNRKVICCVFLNA